MDAREVAEEIRKALRGSARLSEVAQSSIRTKGERTARWLLGPISDQFFEIRIKERKAPPA